MPTKNANIDLIIIAMDIILLNCVTEIWNSNKN